MRDRYNIERHENGMICFTRKNEQLVEGAGNNSLFARGWGKGFVAIPKEHILYGVNHRDIKVTAHNGLSYSEYEDIDDDKYWVFGFDTDGAGDNCSSCDEEYIISETDFLFTQLKSIKQAG
jgi:hypothetical protein